MRSKKEKDELVQQNLRLISSILFKFGISKKEFEDYFSVGMIGLIKAADTFDESRKTKFSTYAYHCIKNEIIEAYNQNKDICNKEISLETPIARDKEGFEATLEERLFDSKSNFEEEIEEMDCFAEYLGIILNYLNTGEKVVILYRIAGYTQRQITDYVNFGRGNVSLKDISAKKKIKNVYGKYNTKGQIYSIVASGLHFIIRCTSEEVNFTDDFIKTLKSLEKNKSSKIVRKSKNVLTIKISAYTDDLCFLARVIEKIDSFLERSHEE